jgi:hypothetical protein
MASHIRIHPSTKIPFHSRAETIGWENTIILNLILVMGTKHIRCEREREELSLAAIHQMNLLDFFWVI